jgi:glycosyltransferase involved in cell wall biosynthesis
MDVVVALDFRFQMTPDGRTWTPTAFSHRFWTRYLEVFDRVRIVARAAPIAAPQAGDRRVDGESVAFLPVPFYLGPAQYLRKARQVTRAARKTMTEHDAVILRASAQLATCIVPMLWRTRHPYGLEVVGDPDEAFAPGAIRHPLRPFFRWRARRMLKQQCARACAAAYVTEAALQRRYPCPTYTAAVSDVELPADLSACPRDWRAPKKEYPLIFVGSFEQMYKAPDVLLDATALCLRSDPAFSLTMIGEGRHLPEMQQRAVALGIQDQVRFLGRLPAGETIRREMDKACLFVLPSRTEGLPRAMLEAMASGLPCVGSAVGGVPELLPPEDLVPPGDAGELARKILAVTRDPERMQRMSARNRQKAAEFLEERLRPRRLAFYRQVAEATQRWIGKQDAVEVPVL